MSPNVFFLLPSKVKFLQQFSDNDKLQAQAENVWRQLDGLTPILLAVTVFVGIGLAVWYYTGYNEMPGRHYKVRHWSLWLVISFVLTLFATFLIECFGITTKLEDINQLYWMCALNNALYCIIAYFVTSIVWCNWCPTNAYRFFKIKKR